MLFTYAILASPFLIWLLIKSHSFYRELKVWNDQYLQNAYVLVFDTTVPKGNSTAEKVLSLTSLIFPQLRADYIDYYYVTNFGWAIIADCPMSICLVCEYFEHSIVVYR